jgi:hypothetical protein
VLDIDHSCSQDLTMVVEDPNGERVDWGWIGNGGCHAHGPIELALDGEHVLELHGGHGSTIADNTGKYRLVPSWLTQREESAASAGSSIDGSISQVFGSQRWTFEASAGSALVIDVDSIGGGCSQDLDMRIEDPFGEEVENLWVGNGGCQSHGPFELERDGQYVLEFAGGNGSTIAKKTGDYTFSFTVSG